MSSAPVVCLLLIRRRWRSERPALTGLASSGPSAVLCLSSLTQSGGGTAGGSGGGGDPTTRKARRLQRSAAVKRFLHRRWLTPGCSPSPKNDEMIESQDQDSS